MQEDSRFDQSVDKSTGYTTRNVLCVPILDASGKIFAVIQACPRAHEHVQWSPCSCCAHGTRYIMHDDSRNVRDIVP